MTSCPMPVNARLVTEAIWRVPFLFALLFAPFCTHGTLHLRHTASPRPWTSSTSPSLPQQPHTCYASFFPSLPDPLFTHSTQCEPLFVSGIRRMQTWKQRCQRVAERY